MQRELRKGRFLAICLCLFLVLALTACQIGVSQQMQAPPSPPGAAAPPPPSSLNTAPPAGPGSPSSPVKPSSDPGSIAAAFDESRAMEHVRTLAQPRFMGRHTGTPGEILGAQYVADQFQQYGLKPGGQDGSYFQEFPVTVTEFSAVPELTLIDQSNRRNSLRLRDDFRPLISGEAGPGSAEGPGVFAGTGDFSKADVRGKIALVVPRVRLTNLVADARGAGALALILTTGQETLLKGELQEPASGGTLPVFLVSARGAEALLEGSGHNRAELNTRLRAGETISPFPLAFSVSLAAQVESREVVARNVIARLPAAGATQDFCLVGGHFEEIGPDPDGVVYPAANDNASGTAVMLEMARLLAEPSPPLRANVLFIGWSGHEEGLLGSAYYLRNPVAPLAQTRCYINLDTVGQGGGQDLLAGVSEARLRGVVEKAQDRLEKATGQRPPVQISQESSGASDHVNFIERGIPSVDLNWTGIFEGGKIHVPEDNADNVDPAKLKVTGQVATAVLLDLAGGAQ